MRIGINGFGRIGRLAFRALWGRPNIELVQINDPAGDAKVAAHLLEFDSVHGRWTHSIRSDLSQILIDEHVLGYAQESDFTLCPWRDAGVDIVLDCSGKNKTPEALSPYFDKLGLSKVIVACPVTGQVAAGANIICFTTGRGSCFGFKPTPSIKIATNTNMYNKLKEDMDINAGSIMDGESNTEAIGKQIFDKIISIASGNKSKSEINGYGDDEFNPWIIGATM